MNLKLEEYDVVVLGSGEAGKYIAWTLPERECDWSSLNGNISEVPVRKSLPACRVASLLRPVRVDPLQIRDPLMPCPVGNGMSLWLLGR